MIDKLTICGTTTINNGIFRPRRSVIHPNKKFPNTPPTHIIEATHEACAIVIFPASKGVSSDVSSNVLAEGHPQAAPYPIDIRFTRKKSLSFYIYSK